MRKKEAGEASASNEELRNGQNIRAQVNGQERREEREEREERRQKTEEREEPMNAWERLNK